MRTRTDGYAHFTRARQQLRTQLFPPLAAIANTRAEKLGMSDNWPASLQDMLCFPADVFVGMAGPRSALDGQRLNPANNVSYFATKIVILAHCLQNITSTTYCALGHQISSDLSPRTLRWLSSALHPKKKSICGPIGMRVFNHPNRLLRRLSTCETDTYRLFQNPHPMCSHQCLTTGLLFR